MDPEEQKKADAATAATAAAEAAAKAGAGDGGAGEGAGAGDQGKGADDQAGIIAKLEADKKNLQTALHNERKNNKGGKAVPDTESLANDLETVKTQLATAEKRGKAMKYAADDAEADIALTYYDKLAQGVTDPKEQDKIMQRAAFLAKADKAGGDDPMNRVTAAMHGGSRGSGATDGAPAPGAVEMGREFGISADRLKSANRPIKGLYNA